MAARATAKRRSSLLVKSNPDTRPIARWQITVWGDDIAWQDFLAFMNADDQIARWRALAMTLDLHHDGPTAKLTTTDRAVAAALVREHGIMWHRSEPAEEQPTAEALFGVEGAYKLHLTFVAPFTSELSARLEAIVKRYGFSRVEELAGPFRPLTVGRPVRQQMWFTGDNRPDAQNENALRGELDQLTANICEISEIDPNDFCNLSLYPGHPGFDQDNHTYMGRGIGIHVSDDDDPGGGEEVDGEPLVDPNSRRAA
jgi:hypothetical protein